jgi:hypothetical protein
MMEAIAATTINRLKLKAMSAARRTSRLSWRPVKVIEPDPAWSSGQFDSAASVDGVA